MKIHPLPCLALLSLATSSIAAQVIPRPIVEPLHEVSFPPYESTTLENGLRVFVLQYAEQPVLTLQLVIGAGAANDPEDLPGLGSFTASLLETGTATRTAQQIAEEIDASGGQLNVMPGKEATTMSVSVLRDTTDLAFELLRDVVLTPSFADEEIARLRQQSLSAFVANMQDPDFVADTVFNTLLYGSHPYGHPADGTAMSLQRIQREDIVRFHDTWYAPETSVLAIVGDIDPMEAFGLAREWFGAWERKAPPQIDLTEREPLNSNRIVVIDNPESVQTEIRIGQTTVGRNAPDYFPVLLTSYVLGGPEGRLMDSLRSNMGLTYGAYEAIEPRKGPGSLYATTETRTETTLQAIEAIFDEIDRLQRDPVPSEELEDVKSYVIGSFPLTIEVPSDLASRLTNIVIYDLGDDYLNTYRDRLAAVTLTDVERIAREQLRREDVLIVLVGNVSEFREGLASFGPVEVIPQAQLDLDSPTLRRSAEQ